jgi:hypothetical protein
MEKVFD